MTTYCTLMLLFVQTVFLWTFIARQIAHSQDHIAVGGEDDSFALSPHSSSQNLETPPVSLVELSVEQKTMIQEVFHLFDTDGQGQLEEKELAGAIFAMGFSTNNHHRMAKNLISKYNGSLSLEQFRELMAGQLAGQDPEEKIKNTFAALCGNYPKVKTINLKRLKTKVKELHIKLTEMELERMIKDVDSSGSGEVGWEEYLQILNQSTWV